MFMALVLFGLMPLEKLLNDFAFEHFNKFILKFVKTMHYIVPVVNKFKPIL